MMKTKSGKKIGNVFAATTLAIATNGMAIGSGLAAEVQITVPFSIEGLPAGIAKLDILCDVTEESDSPGKNVGVLVSAPGSNYGTGSNVKFLKTLRQTIDIDPVTGNATTKSPVVFKETIANTNGKKLKGVACGFFPFGSGSSSDTYSNIPPAPKGSFSQFVVVVAKDFQVAK